MQVHIGADLIRLAQAGDRQALVSLVETYQGPVYSLALTVMRNPTDAADMTQETFVRLLRSLRTYRGDGASFAGWVHRMTVNLCLDTLRRRQRSQLWSRDERSTSDEPREREPVSADVWVQPEWRVEMGESAREVRAALAELPRPQRLALTLHYLEDKRYDEIATTMGVPLNTVKSHILRGKERMAALLSGRGRARLGFAGAI